jgi:hypothetical protein
MIAVHDDSHALRPAPNRQIGVNCHMPVAGRLDEKHKTIVIIIFDCLQVTQNVHPVNFLTLHQSPLPTSEMYCLCAPLLIHRVIVHHHQIYHAPTPTSTARCTQHSPSLPSAGVRRAALNRSTEVPARSSPGDPMVSYACTSARTRSPDRGSRANFKSLVLTSHVANRPSRCQHDMPGSAGGIERVWSCFGCHVASGSMGGCSPVASCCRCGGLTAGQRRTI